MVYQKPKGQRINYGFFGINSFLLYWWCFDCKRWFRADEWDLHENCQKSTTMPCRTVKAYKRAIRKHPEIKKNSILVSKWSGYNVFSGGVTREETLKIWKANKY